MNKVMPKTPNVGIHMMRIPFLSEYEELVRIVECENAVMHWQEMGSLTLDADNRRHDQSKGESPIIIAGGSGALSFEIVPSEDRRDNAGFRPIVTGVNMFNVATGQSVVIGTLYMDGNPVRVPTDPTDENDIVTYVPGAKLQMRESLDDEDYKVYGIYIGGNTFIADRALLRRICACDLSGNIVNEAMPTEEKHDGGIAKPAKDDDTSNPVLSLNEVYEDKNSIFWYWCNATGDINIPGKPSMYCGKEEEMPVEAREIYKTFWNELMDQNCYVIQYNNVFGIGLGFLLDNSYVQDLMKQSSDELKKLSLTRDTSKLVRVAAGKAWAKHIAEINPKAIVFYGDGTDPDGDEIIVFLPKEALTTVEDLAAFSKKLDGEDGCRYFEKMFKTIIPIAVAEILSSLKDLADMIIAENFSKKGSAQDDLYDAGCHDGLLTMMNCMGIKHNMQYLYPF